MTIFRRAKQQGQCHSCRWRYTHDDVKDGNEPGQYEIHHRWFCRRFPPQVASEKNGGCRWPEIGLGHWCGEWESER